jgi:hypothetical protein
MTTEKPASTRWRAVAAPIPELAPVTTAVLGCSIIDQRPYSEQVQEWRPAVVAVGP